MVSVDGDGIVVWVDKSWVILVGFVDVYVVFVGLVDGVVGDVDFYVVLVDILGLWVVGIFIGMGLWGNVFVLMVVDICILDLYCFGEVGGGFGIMM